MILQGKSAVVTGSGQGIGRAIAVALGAAGSRVVVNDLAPESGGSPAEDTTRLIREAGGEAIVVYGDIARMDVCKRLIDAAVENWGGIDILVNNAGVNRDRMIWNMTEEEWDHVINVVLKGTFGCSKHAAAHMREQKRGRIINITSQAGIDGNAGQPNYSAAKAGVIGFTKSCGLALAKYGITVNAIAPQADTRIWRSVTPDRAREMGVVRGLITSEESASIPDDEVYFRIFGSPDDVAPLVVYLASDQAVAINGKVFFASGGRVSLYSAPSQAKTIYKKGRWTVQELSSIVPAAIGI